MQLDLLDFKGNKLRQLDVPEALFGAPIRQDIMARVVHWQLSKRRAGTHKAKGVSEVSGTTKKPWRQKGTGRARQGSLRSVQFRKGGVAHGPIVRSHAYSLPKKVRRLGLISALSAKFKEGKLVVLDKIIADGKTKSFKKSLESFKVDSAVFIDIEFAPLTLQASCNLAHIDMLQVAGVNVYDILRHEWLMLTEASIEKLKERLV